MLRCFGYVKRMSDSRLKKWIYIDRLLKGSVKRRGPKHFALRILVMFPEKFLSIPTFLYEKIHECRWSEG